MFVPLEDEKVDGNSEEQHHGSYSKAKAEQECSQPFVQFQIAVNWSHIRLPLGHGLTAGRHRLDAALAVWRKGRNASLLGMQQEPHKIERIHAVARPTIIHAVF